MTLDEFLSKYDHAGSVVLLEGKRKVTEKDKKKLFRLGQLLAEKSTQMLFRSGNAEGADELFSAGVSSVDKNRLQVITPYAGHRKKSSLAGKTISLDDVDFKKDQEIISLSLRNKKTEHLVKKFVSGTKNRLTMKAAYILRDTVKVTGANNIAPVTAAIFYDHLEKPASGGTGHTMDVCKVNNVPVLDQTVWFKWLSS